MYLARYLLAFIGIYEIAAVVLRYARLEFRDAAARAGEPAKRRHLALQADGLGSSTARWALGSVTLVAVVLGSLIYGGIYFQRGLPFARYGVHGGKTTYDWLFFRGTKPAFVDDWAAWNYSGYEGKPVYGEYRSLISTMQDIGNQRGCGRALWEHQTGDDLSSYGTPMALMLLPFFTDGCIGSMEGLYFEASGTTPYHFLAAAAGSKQASNPVRRLDYQNDDVNLAVRYMQDLGVRYYMAFRPDVVAQADANPDVTPLRQVGPWHIYEVADSDEVVPLTTNPVVVEGHDAGLLPTHIGAKRDRWLELGTSWFQHPEDFAALPVANGPSSWQRITVADDGPKTDDRTLARVQPVQKITTNPLPTVTVSNVVQKDDSISFSVDKVGVPVLVKVSYFPNWKASGAQGPWRAAPNFMVVVPTKNRVTLTYTTSNIEYLGYVLTLLGIVLVFVLWRKGPVRYGPVTEGTVVWHNGQLVWHEEPPLNLPDTPEREPDITADHERFEVLADQVFGPPSIPPGTPASEVLAQAARDGAYAADHGETAGPDGDGSVGADDRSPDVDREPGDVGRGPADADRESPDVDREPADAESGGPEAHENRPPPPSAVSPAPNVPPDPAESG
jgi:hypothetical protein